LFVELGLLCVGILAEWIPEHWLDPAAEEEVIQLILRARLRFQDAKELYAAWAQAVGVKMRPDLVELLREALE